MSDFIQQIILNFQSTSLIEAIAVFFGLLSVWFSKKENILVFPTGIVSVLLYVYICFYGKLYADMFIQFIYFVMSIYGWYNWTHTNGELKPKPISKLNIKSNILYISITIFLFLIARLVLYQTDSDVPNVDALTTAIFMTAMWLMSRKRIEHWIYWIIADAISIPLYIYKDLALTSVQYGLFLIIAIFGYLEWKNNMIKQD